MFSQKSEFCLVESGRSSFQKVLRNKKSSFEFDQHEKQKTDEQSEINIGLFKRFEQFLNNQKLVKLHDAFKKHYGRHYPINYKPEFGFNQYWQDKKPKIQESNILQYFQYPEWYYYLFTFSILISKVGIIWTVSVHRLFQMGPQNLLNILLWGLITVILDIVLQYKLLSHYEYFKENKVVKWAKQFWKDGLLVLYFLAIPALHQQYSSPLLLIDLMVVILLSKRVIEIRRCFHLQITSTPYINSFKMGELLATLLPLAHVFALLLYFVAEQNTEKNWLTAKDLDQLSPHQKYIYSLYFACTTMLTVGYGDIVPVNIPEIIVIMIIQVIGIVTYGYIVNQIGHIISSIRQQDEILSRDIATISKMAKYYVLDKNLVEKAKNHLVCQQKQHTHLTPQEEDNTLKKLHDQLRQQIRWLNSLRIVKSSIFYVCNWTKKFQVQIAKKLHKKIFTPNEEILQTPGKQRVYVFKKGKVEIYANRTSGYKRHFKKILRTIEPNETMEVSDNIYGYSFLMSNTPIKLTAINKEFVVAYYVEKKDFLQTVLDSQLDSEHYFEMKTRIDSMTYPESWEAPLIINTKEHYFPNIQYLIMKDRHTTKNQRNIRSSKIQPRRYRKKSKRFYYRNFDQLQDEQVPVVQIFNPYGNYQTFPLQIKTLTQEKVIPTSITLENYCNISGRISTKSLNDPGVFKKENLHYLLQQGRQYNLFFKKSNRSEVLSKIDNSNFMVRSKKVSKLTQLFGNKIKPTIKSQNNK